MGARISGIASNLLTIEGVKELKGCHHRCLPDMIEVGSYIGLAAMTRSEITIRNVNIRQLGIIPDSFRRLGIRIEERGDDLYIPRQEHYMIEDFIDGSILTVADAPWPGLTLMKIGMRSGSRCGTRIRDAEFIKQPRPKVSLLERGQHKD